MLNEKSAMLLQEKFKDEEFAKKVIGLENIEEVVTVLKEEGIDITEEEVMLLKKAVMVQISKEQNGDELTDEDLEEVAGGFIFSLIKGAASAIASVVSFVHEVTNRRW